MEWRPKVGSRALLHGAPCYVTYLDDRRYIAEVAQPSMELVEVSIGYLTEDPDDRRARRLLEAARDLVNRGYDLQAVTRLQSAVQAIDQAEADHAS